MILISVLMFITALLGMLLFDMNFIFGALMVLCAAGVLVNGLVLKRIIKKRFVTVIIFCVFTAAFLVCALLPASRVAGNTDAPGAAGGSSETAEGSRIGAPLSGEDLYRLKAAAERISEVERGDIRLIEAEQELSQVSEKAKRTEDYYILISDIYMARFGFENSVNQDFLNSLILAVRDCPQSLILNYRAGVIAYALNQYITAESYLARAFELAPEDDPYTPYALAAVYKQMGEDEYAYALMTVAEKNGMLEDDVVKTEGLAEWYGVFKKDNGNKEAAK